jgi:hypothetical protein
MNEHQLLHMYQSWMQGNEGYRRDWARFVELAARQLDTDGAEIMRHLQKCGWFEWNRED